MKTSESYWRQPLKWNKRCERETFIQCVGCGYRSYFKDSQLESFCEKCGDPEGAYARPRVFCASLADVFEDWEGPIVDSKGSVLKRHDLSPHHSRTAESMNGLRRQLFALIDATPNLDWLLLTKRPENIRRMWPETATNRKCRNLGVKVEAPELRLNCWLGTSISDQATADRNVPELLKCRDVSPCLFLSAEPLLGHVQLEVINVGDTQSIDCLIGERSHAGFGGRGGHSSPCAAIDWLIVGGESGHGARPCNVEWIRSLRDQCRAASVPCFIKQLGARPRAEVTGRDGLDWPEGTMLAGEPCERIDDLTALATFSLRDKKGGDWDEWPRNLRVREFPDMEAATNAT